jgi:hypothetical protein
MIQGVSDQPSEPSHCKAKAVREQPSHLPDQRQ